MSTTPDLDPDHPDNWCEYANHVRPEYIPAFMAWVAFFRYGSDENPWTMLVAFAFSDPEKAEARLKSAPKEGVQYVVRTYIAGPKDGTGLLWWEPVGTALGSRPPPTNAVAVAMDQQHTQAAELFRAIHADPTLAQKINESLARAGRQQPSQDKQRTQDTSDAWEH